jgi:hypothetical protein
LPTPAPDAPTPQQLHPNPARRRVFRSTACFSAEKHAIDGKTSRLAGCSLMWVGVAAVDDACWGTKKCRRGDGGTGRARRGRASVRDDEGSDPEPGPARYFPRWRWWRVLFNIFLCFFLRMRLRRFLMSDPMRDTRIANAGNLPCTPRCAKMGRCARDCSPSRMTTTFVSC